MNLKETIALNKRIETLENKVERLEKNVVILEVLAGKLAQVNGFKIEKYQNGLTVISQI